MKRTKPRVYGLGMAKTCFAVAVSTGRYRISRTKCQDFPLGHGMGWRMLGRVNVGEVVIFLISPTPSSAAGKFYQNHENQSKPIKRFIRAPMLSTILGGGGLISTEKLAPSEKIGTIRKNPKPSCPSEKDNSQWWDWSH